MDSFITMSNKPIIKAIVPRRAIPVDATHIAIEPFKFGPPPSFRVIVGVYDEGKKAVPAKGVIGHENYVPAEPKTEPKFDIHREFVVDMKQEQWDAWPGGSTPEEDDAYITDCVLSQLPGYNSV